jgi:hypothetical protein
MVIGISPAATFGTEREVPVRSMQSIGWIFMWLSGVAQHHFC